MAMDPLMQRSLQEMTEKRFSRKHIDPKIRAWFETEDYIQEAITRGVGLLINYIDTEYSYESKNRRIAGLKGMNLHKLVSDVFVAVARLTAPTLLTSITSQTAGYLGWDDKPEAIKTMAEIFAVLCETDAFDIVKHSKFASLQVESRFELPEEIATLIDNGEYLPPMIIEPKELKNNMTSGYLTFNDSLILGAGNHHTGNICLDVLNKVNKTKLSLNTEFLSKVEEEGTEITIEQMIDKAMERGQHISRTQAEERVVRHQNNWARFKHNSYEFYYLLVSQGNEFYLNHKVDERGRMYAQGYHISYQGTAFKKAMIDFADKEVIDVPSDF